MVIGKRGPKSEKETFFAALAMVPGMSRETIEEMWEKKEREKMKISTGKIQSVHAQKAEECVLLSKAFGGMDVSPSTSGKSNRDLERIAECFGDISRRDSKTFAGSLEVSQGSLWFNADAPLRKLCDLAYSITSNPRITIREGSNESAIVETFVDNLRRSMSLDGKETQSRILPALFMALDAFNDSVNFPDETAE